MTRISEIVLWGDGSRHESTLDEVTTFLTGRIPEISIIENGNIWDCVGAVEVTSFSTRLAMARVFDLYKPLAEVEQDPIPGEVAYEEGRILDRNISSGILYDGFRLSEIFGTIPDIGGSSLETLHIILTDRLFGTFDRSDRRYHARVVIFGYPHVLSTTGVIEAPARPREFYLLRRQYRDTGMIPPAVLESLREMYIDRGDPRMGEILGGYALQCLFYQATGEPFCEDRDCCLYNAHWQAEMIRAQTESAEKLCSRHQDMLQAISSGGNPVPK